MALRKFLFMDATEGYSEEQAAADELSLGKATFIGVGGVAIDAGGFLISNVASPVSGTDAANKNYVDSVATGLDLKASVRLATAAALAAVTAAGSGVGKTLTANANGALTVDGVAAANGNRVLVKNQVTTADNGIYVVTDAGSAGTPFILTRSTDADQNSEVTAGMFMFVAEGTVNADTGWVLITNDAITVDTTGLVFSQFSTVNAYTFDQGLLLSGVSVTVELDTAAAAQTAGAGGGSSGLEFDVNTAAGKLRAAVHATGGLERTATGLAAKLLDTSIASAAGGLSVFSAPKVAQSIIVDAAVTAADPVRWSTTNNRVIKALASGTAADARVMGVARTTQGSGGSATDVVSHGPCPGILTGATVNTPYFLASAGGLTTTRPTGGDRVVLVGYALNATDLWVQIKDYAKSV